MPYDKELITHKLIRWEEYLNHYKLPAWKELPDIGLYMDQVIALLAQYLDFIRAMKSRASSSVLTGRQVPMNRDFFSTNWSLFSSFTVRYSMVFPPASKKGAVRAAPPLSRSLFRKRRLTSCPPCRSAS